MIEAEQTISGPDALPRSAHSAVSRVLRRCATAVAVLLAVPQSGHTPTRGEVFIPHELPQDAPWISIPVGTDDLFPPEPACDGLVPPVAPKGPIELQ